MKEGLWLLLLVDGLLLVALIWLVIRLQTAEKITKEEINRGLAEVKDTFSRGLDHGLLGQEQRLRELLYRLDQTQEQLREISQKFFSFQQILQNKQARGALGEAQLSVIVRELLPERCFSLQERLSNGCRADCVVFLPPPIKALVIDAKFPLENYRRLTDPDLSTSEKETAIRQFKADVRKHILDIAEKYIIPGETAEGAVMFIPAEAIFAEIQAHHPDLVELAQRKRVWLASPTTLMAVLTTALAVIKDYSAGEKMAQIRQELGYLAQDFGRFQDHMEKLLRRFDLTYQEAQKLVSTGGKILKRFRQIEEADL